MFCHIVRNSYSALPLSTIINLNKAKRVERSLDYARDDNLPPSQCCCQNCLPKAAAKSAFTMLKSNRARLNLLPNQN